ncbi:PrgI family protein [Peribacillus frigoritolerans]|uniref:PrgI family protein n=1 Tax=Peribacillus TaxID=2675229 RepID=UPI0021A52FF6|nr:PrgI family protein [Peribacillus frigoritolerans]MCT1389851.1 PrgI family protein [Peribacillus frigoritolerans]
MNNNFVVPIPKELKTIKSKLFFGLTKRQLIGFGIALCLGLPVFFMLKSFSLDLAMYGLFLTAVPIIFGTIFIKDGMPAETWLKVFIEYKYLNPQKRYFRVSKRNKGIAEERNLIDVKKIRKTKSISSVSKAR